jgi:glyceraldehyde 3-phosphate dehydrogenase (phosphorylating)
MIDNPVKTNRYEKSIKERVAHEKLASKFIKSISDLWYDKGIETVLYRNQLINKRASDILNLHNYARKFVGQPITIEDTSLLAAEVLKLDICPVRMDIGRLASEWLKEKKDYASMHDFVSDKLSEFIGTGDAYKTKPKDVILYGFGRIGRLLARDLMEFYGSGDQLRLRAIVTRDNSETSLLKRASLLRVDSVHGAFPGTVEVDAEGKALIINGHVVHMIEANTPEEIDYTQFGIHDALVIDNTGVWRDEAGLGRHLKSKGTSKVLLTAPGKGIPNIVHAVNQTDFDPEKMDIFSAASCTTNAIVPVLKVIETRLGIEKGHIETVHAYTNDQNLVDNLHKKYRRGRGAAINMVITETGAGKAAAKALPSLAGKLTSNAIRVPVPDGSLAIMNLVVKKTTSRDEVNELLRHAALYGDLVEQINYSLSHELVSSDIVGNPHPSIFDSKATIVHPDGKNIILYVWYDNEYGYTRQVLRLSKYLAQVRRKRYY